jgi:hypothetical protein
MRWARRAHLFWVCVRIAPNSYPPRVPRGRSPVGSSTSELVIRLVRTVQPLLGPPLLTKSLPPPISLVGCGVVAVMPSSFTGSTGFHLCLLGVDFVRCTEQRGCVSHRRRVERYSPSVLRATLLEVRPAILTPKVGMGSESRTS